MNKILHILLVILFSLTIISCGSDEDEKSTDKTTSTTGTTNTTEDTNTTDDTTTSSDTTAPIIAEVTFVTTPTNDSTPNYTFSSDEAGTITYGGSCSSSTTSATSGNNTITLVSLSDGTYSNCTITVTDSAGNASSSLTVNSFVVDTTSPTVSSTFPSDSASSASIGSTISVTFSESIDNSSVTANTSNTTCSGSMQLSSNNFSSCIQMSSTPSASNTNKTFSVTPSDNLSSETSYKIRVTTLVKDVVGNSMSNSYTTSNGFTSADVTAPILSQVTAITTPTNDNTPDYTFSSSEVGTITYGGSCSSSTTSATTDNNSITLNSLSDGTYSNCTITVNDNSSNSVTLNMSSFVIDTTAPTVSSISPTDNQSGVSISDNISLIFSEAMDDTTVTTNTDNTTCSGSFQLSSDNFSSCVQMSSSPSGSNSNKTFTVDPSVNLSYSTTYKIRVKTGVKDSAGNTLGSQYEASNGFSSEAPVHYGNDDILSMSSSHSPNYLLGTSLVVPQASILDAFALIAVSSGWQVQMALYTDNNGVPDSLFASSAITNATGSGVLELDVTDQPLPVGNYWIMAVFSSHASVSFTTSTSATVKYKALTFGNSLPTSFGSSSSYTGQEFSYYLIVRSP